MHTQERGTRCLWLRLAPLNALDRCNEPWHRGGFQGLTAEGCRSWALYAVRGADDVAGAIETDACSCSEGLLPGKVGRASVFGDTASSAAEQSFSILSLWEGLTTAGAGCHKRAPPPERQVCTLPANNRSTGKGAEHNAIGV